MELCSPTTLELIKALVNAQKDMPGVAKEGTNPRFKNKYARFDDLRTACVETLAANGLVITQHVWPEGDVQYLVTRLSHTSGEWMQSKCILPIQEFSSQNFGSAMTYCKRYTLESLLMLAGEEKDDDDGERSMDRERLVEDRSNQSVPSNHDKGHSGKVESKTFKLQQVKKEVSVPSVSKMQKLKDLVSKVEPDVSKLENYMQDGANANGLALDVYLEEAFVHPDIPKQIAKRYASWLAKKRAAA